MNRTPVRSSTLRSVGYNIDQRTLEIEFKNYWIYEYYNVPIEVHDGLMNAASHGKYFNENIKESYEFKRIH